MLSPRSVVVLGSVATMVAGSNGACSQDFPTRPLRIITSEAGGGNDFISRVIAVGLGAGVNQQVIVENRGGASGAIAAQGVARSAPDGYTMLLYSGTLWIVTLLQKMPYEIGRDLSPITLTTRQPNIVVVHPSLSVKTVQELVALAKRRPGELNYASASIGGSTHLSVELFKSLTGVNIVHVPYRGTGPALTDLMSGQMQVMFAVSGGVTPYTRSGRLRALAVTSAEPSLLAPGLPTVAASGLPGYESVSMHAMFAPAKTPVAIIHRLNQEIVRVLGKTDVKEKLFNSGVEVVGTSPEELNAKMKAEMAQLGKLIRDVGIKAE